MQVLKTEVLTSPYIWLFAISYFFVYVIRQGATSWLIFYLKVSILSPVASYAAKAESHSSSRLSQRWPFDTP